MQHTSYYSPLQTKLFRWFKNKHLKANPGKTDVLVSTEKPEIVSIDRINRTYNRLRIKDWESHYGAMFQS